MDFDNGHIFDVLDGNFCDDHNCPLNGLLGVLLDTRQSSDTLFSRNFYYLGTHLDYCSCFGRVANIEDEALEDEEHLCIFHHE